MGELKNILIEEKKNNISEYRPSSCGECKYLIQTERFPCFCVLGDYPIKPSETDVIDGICYLYKRGKIK